MKHIGLRRNEIRRSFQIVTYGAYTTLTVNQVSNLLAQFDWSLLPESRYIVSVTASLISANNTLNNCPQIFCDLGQMDTNFAAGSNSRFTSDMNYSQTHCATYNGPTNYNLQSNSVMPWSDCVRFYLNSRPSKNIFEIVTINSKNKAFYTPNMNQSMICFTLEMIDDVPRPIRGYYNVTFNSDFGVSNLDGLNSWNSSKNYKFDWSQLPEGKYSVLTSFNYNFYVSNFVVYSGLSLFANFGQADKTVFITNNSSNARMSKRNMFCPVLPLIGTGINEGGGNGLCYAGTMNNPPIFLDSRPNVDVTTIELNTWYAAQFIWGTVPPPEVYSLKYTCTFCFRWLGE